MDSDERGLGRDQVDVGEFPSSDSPSWRGWLLKFLGTAEQLNWNYETCCQMMSESLRGAVFNAFLEAKLFVEVELERPSVSDLLSRTVQVIGVSQIELIEERWLLELRQRKEENISDYARRVGAFKTLALKTVSDEHWASICLSGLNDECLRDVVKDPAKATLIVRELERQDCLEQQLNGLWAKMHRVRRRHTEPQAQAERMPTDKENFNVDQKSGSLQKLTILSKEKQTRSIADVDSSNAAQRKNEETKSESIAHTNAARVTRSTSAWKASYWGGEDSDDDCDDLVGDHEGTAHKQHQRTELWSYSRDEESSDAENDELWSELYSDDDYDCPYELVTLEEALRQFDESKKARLASGNPASLTAPEKGYELVPTPETLMWNNEAAERSSVFHVRSWEVVVQRLWVEYDVEINVQMDYVDCPERGLMESAIVRLNHEKAAADFEQMSAERTTLSSERCSFTLEARMELSQRTNETWEVESGHCTTQAVECNFKAIEEPADLSLERVKQDSQNWMNVRKAEAGRSPHGIQTWIVEDEPQWDTGPSARVARTAWQCVPDHNVDTKRTEASSARLKRRVWTSFLWFMTAWWVQVNVLYARVTTWPLNALPRSSNGWYRALWPPSITWERAVSRMCEEDWRQQRHCFSSRSCCRATKSREGQAPYIFEQSDRSWIRQKGSFGVELMFWNTDSSNANTSVLDVGMMNNHSEVNEKLAEAPRDNPRGQILEGKPLSTPSRMMLIKLSRICLTHPRHETEMTSVSEPRETSGKPLGGQTSEGHREAWNSSDARFPSKCPTMSDEHRAARKIYDRGKTHWNDEDTCEFDEICKAMATAEGKWWRKLKTHWDFISMPASRWALCTGQLSGYYEHGVAVSNAVWHCWVCHRKHGRWKAEEHAAQILDEKMTYRVTTRYHDAFPKDCEMSNENW